jgi:hypothetical protein
VAVHTSSSEVSFSVTDATATFQRARPGSAGASLSLLDDPGRPAVPVRLVNVLLPPGHRVAEVTASAKRTSVLARDVAVTRAGFPRADPDADRPAAAPLPSLTIDTGEGTFPPALVQYLGSGLWHGQTIASFAVYPVRIEGRQLLLCEDIELEVEIQAGDAGSSVRAQRGTERAVSAMRESVASLVANPQDAAAYSPIAVSTPRGPFLPSSVPSLEGSPVDYVIITTASMETAFDSLAIWKTARGVPTVVRTVEWIEANYRRGADRAETVRYFIQDAYEKWGVQWVLLAGDTPEIPARYFYSAYYFGGSNVPSDLYFAGLDGDFNADHDSRFGEQPDDSPDLYPEVYVGRLPVSTPVAAAAVIRKIKRYEKPAKPQYTDKVLHLSEVLFPSGWSPPAAILQNGADITEYLNTLYIGAPQRRVTRCYETEWLYPGSVHESRLTAIDSLNAGYNQVFHIGHGYRFNMHCGDDNVAIPDADELYHPDEYFNLYMLNCTAAAFDYDCLGEHLLRNPNGGAVSVLGAANSAFADVSAYYMEDYVSQLYVQGRVHVGETFALGRAVRTGFAVLGDNADLWTHYIYTLLGDPEMPMWTEQPKTPVVTHVPTLPAGVNNFTVQVLVNGLPKAGATVCVWKAAEDYQVQNTNVAGNAAFSFLSPTPGPIQVVVSGANLKRYDGQITVTAAAGAMPVVETVTVDDDNVGGTTGNADGVIDAGETVDLLPSVRNRGGASSPAANATLTILNSNGVMLDATAAVPAAAPGALVSAADPWRVHVDQTTPDEYALDLLAVLTSGPSSWVSRFSRVVHAPRVELVSLRRSDQLPVGNGNGVITNGETFLLFATIKNFGTGSADGLVATLRAMDAGSTVIDSVVSFPSLDLLQAGESAAGFKLSEASVSLANALRIVLTDSHGRTLTHDFELREPLAPALQGFDASLGVDKMGITWSAGSSPDVRGYNIYRSAALAGPYTRANSDVIAHTMFVDVGLAPSTRYYYQIASVDHSGNEGPPSTVAFASTNPPQLDGWPLELVDPSANSAVIGDIDGYGADEVIVGNDRLYAWHADGEELVDGDLQAVTWGVISPQGDDFIGPAALAELDGSPGFEIVAAAYTSKQVFCFQDDGTVLPGWPKNTVDVVRAGVTAGDIDGDDAPEIVAVDQDAYLYAWHADGTEVIDGDANPLTNGVFKRLPDTTQWQYQMPALADLDNDGKEEIIIPTQDNKVYVLNETAGNEPGWPFSLPGYAGGGVAVGDIDNNGDLEIVVSVRNSGEVYALHHNATQMWLIWINSNLFFNPSPALADLTGDGRLETIIPSSSGRLYAIQYNGSQAPGWPIYYSTKTYTESSPVVADVNGDGSVDVLLGDEGRFINAWSSTGVLLDGFPLVTKDAVRGTPAVGDIDKDGRVDIVGVGYDKTVYVWALDAPYNPAKAPWPMYHANILRNGLYGVTVPTGADDPAPVAHSTRLAQNVPNPFNPATRISFEIANGPPGRVTLTVYDVTGARVRTLFDEVARPGVHTALWDGRNARGEAVGSGVYFYRLATTGGSLTRKMLLLK